MSVHSEEVRAGRVDAGNNEVGTDVALVAEEMLLEQRHAGYDAGLAAGREGMQLKVGGDDGRRELCVSGSTGTCAPDLWCNVVQLLAVLRNGQRAVMEGVVAGDACLVCYYRAACCAGVCCNHHAAVEETSHNGRSGARRLGEGYTLGVEGCIAVVVGEVEARHVVMVCVMGWRCN